MKRNIPPGPPPPSPILLNATMVKINPRGKKITMFIPHFHGFSHVVARGHHLRLPLRSQNCKSCALRGEKYATINHKTRQRWHNFCHCDQICHWRGRTPSPPATRLPTPSQDPSRHDLSMTHCTTAGADKFGRRTTQQARQQMTQQPTNNRSVGGAMTLAKAAAMVTAEARARAWWRLVVILAGAVSYGTVTF